MIKTYHIGKLARLSPGHILGRGKDELPVILSAKVQTRAAIGGVVHQEGLDGVGADAAKEGDLFLGRSAGRCTELASNVGKRSSVQIRRRVGGQDGGALEDQALEDGVGRPGELVRVAEARTSGLAP